MKETVCILGNGIAGTSAAIELAANSRYQIVLISDETQSFFSRTALMYVYMGHMRWEDLQPYEEQYWSELQIHRKQGRVKLADFKGQKLHFESGESLSYDILVIASGSAPKFSAWPGQDLTGVSGMVHKWDLEYLEKLSPEIKQAVVVGGGLIGVELAEMLHSRKKEVCMVVREKAYWSNILPEAEAEMVNRQIRKNGIDLRLHTELREIRGDEHKRVKSVILNHGEELKCQYVGVAIGVEPRIKIFINTLLETDRGILVDEFLRTNIPNVYAAGDCAQLRNPASHRRAVEAVWYSGREMGKHVAKNICGDPSPYCPGIWFNSAKFFDLEYQVYGNIQATSDSETNNLYWEHKNGEKSIRIQFRKSDHVVSGFNLMGIRFRQEICQQWISNKSRIEEVLQQISLAFFDPEFDPDYSSAIVHQAQKDYQISVNTNKNKIMDSILGYFKSGSNY